MIGWKDKDLLNQLVILEMLPPDRDIFKGYAFHLAPPNSIVARIIVNNGGRILKSIPTYKWIAIKGYIIKQVIVTDFPVYGMAYKISFKDFIEWIKTGIRPKSIS